MCAVALLTSAHTIQLQSKANNCNNSEEWPVLDGKFSQTTLFAMVKQGYN